MSDKYITQQSGFLELVKPVDSIMTNRGFNVTAWRKSRNTIFHL